LSFSLALRRVQARVQQVAQMFSLHLRVARRGYLEIVARTY